MGGNKCTEFWSENLMRRNHLEDLGIDGRIILKLCLKETGYREKYEPMACFCEHSN
jgi:hypothetical protein